jgi:endonuclease/exonuclease/phosphatase family metal-dependent hydrolase
MFAELEAYLHRFRRVFDRSEWAIRHLHLPVSGGTAEEPGLLLIQIDGLGRGELEAAIGKGQMPFLAGLRDRSKYNMRTFYSGLPSTTPAVQAELYYGIRAGVPAFSFMDRVSGEVETMFNPELVRELEREFASRGEPLLKGGSSWSNIYSGGAAEQESHFCIGCLGRGGILRKENPGAQIAFVFLELPAILRIVGLVILELLIGLWDFIGGLFMNQRVELELGLVLSRMCVGIAMREILRVGGKLDLARGLPVVHINFLGYDEMAHRRGPGSGFAHWALGGIDHAIRDLYSEAHRSRRRDYQVWIFSDHGQERTRSFETECAGGTKGLVAACLSPEDLPAAPARSLPLRRPYSRRLYERERRKRTSPKPPEETFAIAAMGPVGHIYFSTPPTDEEKRVYARQLVVQGKIPAVLHLNADRTMTWHDAKGTIDPPADIAARLDGYPSALRGGIVADLQELCRHENAGDLVILGHGGSGECRTFAAERGSHGGIGPREVSGFLLTPPATRFPAGSTEFVRPSGLRAAALHVLGRQPLDAASAGMSSQVRLRVMTYNVHGCLGTDGRVSPRRIARIIAQQNPDIVALQELDHGRSRSRGEDQASLIADLLGYHVVFCPTVIVGTERYGHAVLSRLPIETVKVAELPGHPRSLYPERRGALWSRIKLGDLQINVVTTHLGLSPRERHAQMTSLLGSEWIGPVLPLEPVILCGDFNCLPGGPSHRIALTKLKDVAGTRRLNTFSSVRPFVRLDYIFTTGHFLHENVTVLRNPLTRVSSDHLPLLVDVTVRA